MNLRRLADGSVESELIRPDFRVKLTLIGGDVVGPGAICCSVATGHSGHLSAFIAAQGGYRLPGHQIVGGFSLN